MVNQQGESQTHRLGPSPALWRDMLVSLVCSSRSRRMSRCRQADSPGQAASCHSPRKKRTWWVDRLRDHNRVSTHRSRVARGRVMRGIHSGLKSTESCLFQPGLQVAPAMTDAVLCRRASLALLAATALWNSCCAPGSTLYSVPPRSHNWHGIPRLTFHSKHRPPTLLSITPF